MDPQGSRKSAKAQRPWRSANYFAKNNCKYSFRGGPVALVKAGIKARSHLCFLPAPARFARRSSQGASQFSPEERAGEIYRGTGISGICRQDPPPRQVRISSNRRGCRTVKHLGRRSAYRSPKHSLVESPLWKVTPPSALEKLARTGFNYLHKDDTVYPASEATEYLFAQQGHLLGANTLQREPLDLDKFREILDGEGKAEGPQP